MNNLYNKLLENIRFQEGSKACINCGTAQLFVRLLSFYNYDPRIIVDTVQSRDEDEIENLLKSETIWYCGECMSCKTRCPRGNAPGLVIMALRALSQELGYFVESEKGRQQIFMKRVIGGWILTYGYCLYLEGIGTNMYPEQGPIWDWKQKNWAKTYERLGGNYKGDGPGMLRKIPEEALDEVRKIFEVTGGKARFEKIERFSKAKAEEMNLKFDNGIDNEYFNHIYSHNNNTHSKK